MAASLLFVCVCMRNFEAVPPAKRIGDGCEFSSAIDVDHRLILMLLDDL